jgi:hypothetical protein
LLNASVVLYAAKTFLQVTIYALEVILPNEMQPQGRRRYEGSLSFRSFGDVCSTLTAAIDSSLMSRYCPQPFTVPKDAYDVTILTKTIGICTEKGIVVGDPTKWAAWSSPASSTGLTFIVQFDEWHIFPCS